VRNGSATVVGSGEGGAVEPCRSSHSGRWRRVVALWLQSRAELG